ncbi:uncharacterized protein LOC126659717 [Mercurialis annua]|uniref:uncharacterized protein LOC126659717 n=1 Tax=Mercurialis annua TaxID=3986 RepID=UPI00215E4A53|nr:uncharacterized protein LOC126659717 [Mercurialis annua]
MASVYVLKSTLSPISSPHANFTRNSNFKKKTIFKLKKVSSRSYLNKQKFSVCCSVQDGDSQTNGEEAPESLFMKELKRRGMSPTSLLEESDRGGGYGLEDKIKMGEEEEDLGFFKRKAVSTGFDKSLSNQRDISMALNSEGLEGLIPRAKLLLTIGGTFFLGFWPLILVTVGLFYALYFFFGSSFVHDGNNVPVLPPPYIDPYELLEDERISQIAPSLK